MKRIWLLAIFICFTASIASAQIRFSKYFGIEGFQDFSSDVLVQGDSAYFFVTSSVDFFQIDTLGFAVTSIVIVKTDKYGDTLWTKIFRKKNFSIEFNTFAQTKDGYILVGNVTDLVAYENEQKGGYFAIWKLNNEGDTISTSYYDVFNGNDYATQLIHTIDSGFAVVGQSCNQIQSGANCDFVMLKLDLNGTVQWHKSYSNNSSSFESGNSLTQLPNGDFFLVGYTQLNGLMKTFVVKTNSSGDLIWKKKFDLSPRESSIYILYNQNNNNLYLFGSYNSEVNGSGKSRGHIINLDTVGNLNWRKTYGGIEDNGFFAAISFNNNIILATGLITINNNSKGWFIKLNSNGDSIFQQVYDINNRPHNLYSIQKAIDGLIMAGYGINPNSSPTNQDAWLLKVDTFGCLTPGCQLVGINNIPFNSEEIKIYPNPSKNKIQFEHSAKIISYRIADYTGKLLLDGAYNSINIDVSALPAGAYIVQVLLENGSQAFGKMVIEL
jgi:Secretion system C-terminal sorting domain